MKYDDTKFLRMFRTYGGMKRIITNPDFLFSLPLGFMFAILAWYFSIIETMINIVCPVFITVSATMIAVAIAGLAIIVSMSDPHFIKILKEANVYKNILFTFWFSTCISGLSIMTNIITYVTPHIICRILVITILLWASTFLVLYSTFSVILLVGTTMRYGLYRGEFLDRDMNE